MTFHAPERSRIIMPEGHPLHSTSECGNNGAFRVGKFNCIISDTMGWEHVSVAIAKGSRTPVWEEMCKVKESFWDAEDCVIQYHPPESNYVNFHPYVLHLWRSTEYEIPRPPSIMVGPNRRQR